MKFLLLLFAILGGVLTMKDIEDVWSQREYGLCIGAEPSCPQRMQKYGVCCKINGINQFFNNFCLACQAGCDEWTYLQVKGGTC